MISGLPCTLILLEWPRPTLPTVVDEPDGEARRGRPGGGRSGKGSGRGLGVERALERQQQLDGADAGSAAPAGAADVGDLVDRARALTDDVEDGNP